MADLIEFESRCLKWFRDRFPHFDDAFKPSRFDDAGSSFRKVYFNAVRGYSMSLPRYVRSDPSAIDSITVAFPEEVAARLRSQQEDGKNPDRSKATALAATAALYDTLTGHRPNAVLLAHATRRFHHHAGTGTIDDSRWALVCRHVLLLNEDGATLGDIDAFLTQAADPSALDALAAGVPFDDAFF